MQPSSHEGTHSTFHRGAHPSSQEDTEDAALLSKGHVPSLTMGHTPPLKRTLRMQPCSRGDTSHLSQWGTPLLSKEDTEDAALLS